MNNSLTIIGAGAWGSALAIALSDKFDTIYLITKNKENTETIGNQHPALTKPFNRNIKLDSSYTVIPKSMAVLIATPSSSFSDVLDAIKDDIGQTPLCLLYTSPSPRDGLLSRMPSSA